MSTQPATFPKTIEFSVRFITPLIIGGANARELDRIGLTGKALRGCWRFWFRAIVGGILDASNIDLNKVKQFEEKVFGSTKRATFRLSVEPTCIKSDKYQIVPGKKFKVDGYSPGSTFRISVIPRRSFDENEYKILLRTIWIWAHLGAVGRRARRGFGSVVICGDRKAYDLFKNHDLPLLVKTPKRGELQAYLSQGLKTVWENISAWIKQEPEANPSGSSSSTDISTNSEPAEAPYFILKSLKQVRVGKKTWKSLYSSSSNGGVLNAVRGMSNCPELGWIAKKGSRSGRFASPVFVRIHKIVDDNGQEVFCPVATWCKQKGIPVQKSCAKQWLEGIGLTEELGDYGDRGSK